MAGETKVTQRCRGALIGALLLVLVGCSIHATNPATGGPGTSQGLSDLPGVPDSASVAPAGLALETAVPTTVQRPTLPPALAGFKTVDFSRFSQPSMPAAPYRIAQGSHGLVLAYDTGKAKGSIAIVATKAEVTHFSQGPSRQDVVWDASYVVVVLVAQPKYTGPVGIGSGQTQWFLPMGWRILVAPLDKNGKPAAFAQFAAGRSILKVQTPNFECGECSGGVSVWPPNVGLSGGLIAYNVERPTTAHPFGAGILLRSLVDGSTIRDLTTPDYVDSLQLSGANVVWMEYPGVTTGSLPLRISTATSPAARDLLVYKTPGDSGDMEWDVPLYILAGKLLVWEAASAGQVWERDVSTGKIRQISPDGLVCRLSDFDGTDVVMGCSGDLGSSAYDSHFTPDAWVFWSPSAGSRVLTGPAMSGSSYSCGFSGGSLWVDSTDLASQTDTFWGIPIAILTGS